MDEEEDSCMSDVDNDNKDKINWKVIKQAPQGLKIKETLLRKYDETRHFVCFHDPPFALSIGFILIQIPILIFLKNIYQEHIFQEQRKLELGFTPQRDIVYNNLLPYKSDLDGNQISFNMNSYLLQRIIDNVLWILK